MKFEKHKKETNCNPTMLTGYFFTDKTWSIYPVGYLEEENLSTSVTQVLFLHNSSHNSSMYNVLLHVDPQRD